MLGLTQPYHKKHSPGEGWAASVSYLIKFVNFLEGVAKLPFKLC